MQDALAELLGLTAEELFELAWCRRGQERAAAERRLEEVARMAELRENWRSLIADRPALGYYLMSVAS
jgi:hypothetical protein